MITTYSINYRTQLCEFFSRIIESHKAYISHGELQMGIALDGNELAPNYKEMWLKYLDRQVENPDNTLLLYLEDRTIIGFVLFGITNDGASPYGVIFDLSVEANTSGRSYCKEQQRVSGQMEYRIVISNRESITIRPTVSLNITALNKYPTFSD